MTPGVTCLVGYGANLGDPLLTLEQSAASLSCRGWAVEMLSEPLVTKPIGGIEQTDYVNAVFRMTTSLSIREAMASLLEVEREFGRVRVVGERWGPRPIDLDLLLYGDELFFDAELRIPHPRMTFRRFALKPAADIAGELTEPISRCTIRELLHRISTPGPIWWLAGNWGEIESYRPQFPRLKLTFCPSKNKIHLEDSFPNCGHPQPIGVVESLELWREKATEARLLVLSEGDLEATRDAIHGPHLILPTGLPLPDALRELTAAVAGMD